MAAMAGHSTLKASAVKEAWPATAAATVYPAPAAAAVTGKPGPTGFQPAVAVSRRRARKESTMDVRVPLHTVGGRSVRPLGRRTTRLATSNDISLTPSCGGGW